MSTDKPTSPSFAKEDVRTLRLAIAASQFNPELANQLLKSSCRSLMAAGVPKGNIGVIRVPGANELPYVIHQLSQEAWSGLMAIGVVVAGQTQHHHLIGNTITDAFQRTVIESKTPVINGVIVTENREQAAARCHPEIGRGPEFASALLSMAILHEKSAFSPKSLLQGSNERN